MNENDIRIRVIYLLKDSNISVRAMAARLGMPQKNLNNQVSGSVALSLKTLMLLISQFPEVSAEWLLRGEGDMYRVGNSKGVLVDSAHFGHHNNTNIGGTQEVGVSDVEIWRKLVADKEQQIADLKADKEKLYQLLMRQ